jgi:hypothetical protein
LEPRYYAGLTTYATYEEIDIGERRGIRPDLTIVTPNTPRATGPNGARVATPVRSRVPLEVPSLLRRIEIRIAGTDKLVTVIEILSPVNKQPAHPAYRDYHRKRHAILGSDVHLVEIDLLRAGVRPPLATSVPAAPYYVVLSRASARPDVDVWPIALTDTLPVLPVPLLAPDPDATLDLQAAFAAIYARAGYGRRVDYARPPLPPLTPEEAIWIDGLLAARR